MHPQFPYGKGLWIWTLPDCMGGDVQAIIAQCLRKNISYVIVKAGDGVDTWDQFTQDLVDKFHIAGIKIYSWSYVYGNNPVREAAIAMWALDMGVDGHVFDAEGEYEGKPTQAVTMLEAVRAHAPNAFLAYAPFPIIDLHTNYPYIEFGKYCDAVMPQIYWGDFEKTPTEALNWTYDNFSRWQETWKNEGHGDSVKPLIPLGQAYDNSATNYKSTPEDVAEFINACAGYMSVNFWSFQHILADAIWEAIRINKVDPPKQQATPPPTPPLAIEVGKEYTQTDLPSELFNVTDQQSIAWDGQPYIVTVNTNGTRTFNFPPVTPVPTTPTAPVEPVVPAASVPDSSLASDSKLNDTSAKSSTPSAPVISPPTDDVSAKTVTPEKHIDYFLNFVNMVLKALGIKK